MAIPDFSKPFFLETDASITGVGAVILQESPVLGQDGKPVLRPVHYLARQLSKHEVNYPTREKEALAIVWAIDKLRHYLLGRKFTVLTDHGSLVWLTKADKPGQRITRWAQKLAEFDFEVKYVPGVSNVRPDAFSRMFEPLQRAPQPQQSLAPARSVLVACSSPHPSGFASAACRTSSSGAVERSDEQL